MKAIAAACGLALGLAASGVRADVGPAVVAKADLALWPGSIATRAGFDRASRAAILVYADALADAGRLSEAGMRARFGVRSVDAASTRRWMDQALAQAVANYRLAAADCAPGDWTCVAPPATPAALVAAAAGWNDALPAPRRAWRDDFAAFARAYAGEQLRLAALFPQVTSEIDRFGEDEWNGDALPDRSFQLTFDDGPTPPGGTTEATLRMLDAAGRHAVFFLLGSGLQARAARPDAAAFVALYANQCVASHGWEHQSHQHWALWQDSVVRTKALLAATFPRAEVMPYFRPPYGQRRADSGPFFEAQGLQVALWNLDSQDWSAHVGPSDVIDRMISLMLVRRHGVMLFHDVHPKAKEALPAIFAKVGDAVDWRDCRVPMPRP
ncbi:MAG: polysaccharide deacetylase family protein [Burkholderiaceae bacterium]